MTYNEIKKSGVAMSLSYYEGGGSPVYKINEHEGLYLVFPPIEADISGNVSDEFLNDNFPKKLLIQSKDIYVYPGISVGMSAEEVKLFHIEWEDIYIYEFGKLIILYFFPKRHPKDNFCMGYPGKDIFRMGSRSKR